MYHRHKWREDQLATLLEGAATLADVSRPLPSYTRQKASVATASTDWSCSLNIEWFAAVLLDLEACALHHEFKRTAEHISQAVKSFESEAAEYRLLSDKYADGENEIDP